MPSDAFFRSLRRGLYGARRYLFWLGNIRPRRMYRRRRPEDGVFTQDEKLFFRCKRGWVDGNAQVKPAHVHFPDQSVNREKYSKPGDVLLPDRSDKSNEWIYWGVASTTIADIPEPIETEGRVEYSFTAEHDPLDDNYGHTELRVYKDGNRESNKKKINNQIKKKYRTILALSTHVIIRPLA